MIYVGDSFGLEVPKGKSKYKPPFGWLFIECAHWPNIDLGIHKFTAAQSWDEKPKFLSVSYFMSKKRAHLSDFMAESVNTYNMKDYNKHVPNGCWYCMCEGSKERKKEKAMRKRWARKGHISAQLL